MPVFSMGSEVSPVTIAQEAIKRANALLCDTVLIDTAGRLHIDEKLMDELKTSKPRFIQMKSFLSSTQ